MSVRYPTVYLLSTSLKPFTPKVNVHILHTVLWTNFKMLSRRICLTIKSLLSWWLFIAFNEGEGMLIVSFLGKSLSRVFMDQSLGDQSWCHAISGIGRHLGLAGYVAQIASISCANVFLGRLELKTPIFFLCNQYNKKISY